jgi:hypothetical protein
MTGRRAIARGAADRRGLFRRMPTPGIQALCGRPATVEWAAPLVASPLNTAEGPDSFLIFPVRGRRGLPKSRAVSEPS